MELFEQKALTVFDQIVVTKWYRHVDDTFVVIKGDKKQAFFDHIDVNINFTEAVCKDLG